MKTITLNDLKVGMEYKSTSSLGWTYIITKIDDKMVYSDRTNCRKSYTKSGLLKKDCSRLSIGKFVDQFEKYYEII